jgi:hypothetical protein
MARVTFSTALECLLVAQSRHAQRADECPLLGAKRTFTNRCLPNSIYEYTVARFIFVQRCRRYRTNSSSSHAPGRSKETIAI